MIWGHYCDREKESNPLIHPVPSWLPNQMISLIFMFVFLCRSSIFRCIPKWPRNIVQQCATCTYTCVYTKHRMSTKLALTNFATFKVLAKIFHRTFTQTLWFAPGHWTCWGHRPSAPRRSPCPSLEAQLVVAVARKKDFETVVKWSFMRPAPLAASSGRPPTSWCSWGCGWRWTWCRSLCHRCSMTLASSLPSWERNHSAGQRCQVSVSSPLTCVEVKSVRQDQLRSAGLVSWYPAGGWWCRTSCLVSYQLVRYPGNFVTTAGAAASKFNRECSDTQGRDCWSQNMDLWNICSHQGIMQSSLCWELLSLVCIYARAHWLQLIAKVRVEPWQEGKALSQLVSASIFNWDKQQTTFSNLLRSDTITALVGIWHFPYIIILHHLELFRPTKRSSLYENICSSRSRTNLMKVFPMLKQRTKRWLIVRTSRW